MIIKKGKKVENPDNHNFALFVLLKNLYYFIIFFCNSSPFSHLPWLELWAFWQNGRGKESLTSTGMPVWLAGGDRWAGQEWLGGPEEQGRKGRQT